jgi:uncharacterized repeat protein (TIGR03803 family)
MNSPFGYFSHSQTSRAGTMVLALMALLICSAAPATHAQTFKCDPGYLGPCSFTNLYDFAMNTGDPRNPSWPGVFAQGRDGNLYSTSPFGGIGYGTVFQLTPTGAVKVLYQFPLGTNSHGGSPQGGLTLGTDGYLYGTTKYLGSSGSGSVFKIATDGTGYKTLYSFTGADDGELPYTAPIQGVDGNFYGTTSFGHHGTAAFPGSVYKLTPTPTGSVLKTLYEFDKTHGAYPTSLMQGTDSNFYGTTQLGGTGICNAQCGVIFKMTPAGQLVWVHNFTGTDGANPYGPIIQASDGNFYGTTRNGGSAGEGVVYKITPAGGYTVLFSFNGTSGPGTNPYAGLVQATDGKFYGAAVTALAGKGILYQTTSAARTYTTVYTFTPTTGQLPFVSLFQNTNGILYSDTSGGGTGSLCHCGVAYSLNLGLHPFVALLTTSGNAGQVSQILGNGLTGTTSVKFGTGSASFTVVSDTYMTAVVPATGTTGAVTVATPSGFRVSSKNFRVLPVISSFSPTSGPVGTQVVIKGTGLTQTTKVTFGGVAATSFTKSATQVTAPVPTGAVTGKIGITTAGGTATSATVFTVTP